jgi:Right handed beta helix region
MLLGLVVSPAASARAQADALGTALIAQDGHSTVRRYCAAVPSKCGYPDGSNTGIPSGTTLKVVPGQVSSGPGWHYNALHNYVEVNGKGAVLSALYIPCNLDISASGVTIKDSHIVTIGSFGISLRHAAGAVIEDSIVSGRDSTTGRLDAGIMDIYGDSTGMVIKNDNILYARTALLVDTGTVSGNYIHAFGYIAGDHTNGIFDPGSTAPLTIDDNTILDSHGQTDAISLDSSLPGLPVANKTIKGNLLAGGSYTLYGGDSLGNVTYNILIEGNRFSKVYYPKSGQYGPAAYFGLLGLGNTWSGNVWDNSGRTVPPP